MIVSKIERSIVTGYVTLEVGDNLTNLDEAICMALAVAFPEAEFHGYLGDLDVNITWFNNDEMCNVVTVGFEVVS